jgi:putative transcriptional regulator
MSKALKSIKTELNQTLAHAGGRLKAVRESPIAHLDVRQLHAGIGLTKEQFSSKFVISSPTLRHWARGDCKSQGAALVLLNVIGNEPKAVSRSLA